MVVGKTKKKVHQHYFVFKDLFKCCKNVYYLFFWFFRFCSIHGPTKIEENYERVSESYCIALFCVQLRGWVPYAAATVVYGFSLQEE
jgi:hypothetical protein